MGAFRSPLTQVANFNYLFTLSPHTHTYIYIYIYIYIYRTHVNLFVIFTFHYLWNKMLFSCCYFYNKQKQNGFTVQLYIYIYIYISGWDSPRVEPSKIETSCYINFREVSYLLTYYTLVSCKTTVMKYHVRFIYIYI